MAWRKGISEEKQSKAAASTNMAKESGW